MSSVQEDGALRTPALAQGGRLRNQGASDATAAMRPRYEEAAQIPEVLNQDHAYDLILDYRYKVNTVFRSLEPNIDVGVNVLDHHCVKVSLHRVLDGRMHEALDGRDVLASRGTHKRVQCEA